jgi:hypothetical protein
MVDQVVPRGELQATIARILSLLRQPDNGHGHVAAEILPPLGVEHSGAE